MKTTILIILAGCTMFSLPAFSQDHINSHNKGLAGISYTSNAVYLGRRDSVDLPYLTAVLGYHASSGFFVEGSTSLALSSGAGFDMFEAKMGYGFDIGNFNGEFSAAHEFYSDKSFSVKSAIQNTIAFSGSYSTSAIGIMTEDALNFSSSPDLAIGLGLNHRFSWMKDALSATPQIMANASSQNYYKDYFLKKKYSVKRRRKNAGTQPVTINFNSSTNFRLMDYEISLPFEYTQGRYNFFLDPIYAIPENPAQVKVNAKVFTEKLDPCFYGEVGVKVKF
jgi:hypothetical protein